jgi:methylenetetrahydrofolate reductase (NADPH)
VGTGHTQHQRIRAKVVPQSCDPSTFFPVPEMTQRSNLQTRLEAGRFVLTAEIVPPVSFDPRDLLGKAASLKGVADAVNVTDGAGAKAHMSALAAAALLLQNGVEPVLQLVCRDRNRIALQADLMGAAALGIRNLLALYGDKPSAGDQPEAKEVYDLDTRALTRLAQQLRDTATLPTGTKVQGDAGFYIGAADAPIDPPPDWQPDGLKAKIAAGAQFAQTQFCMDIGVVRRYAARLTEAGVLPGLKLIVGVNPLRSAASARWMQKHLFGTIIPEAMIARLEAAADPAAEGKRLCVEFIEELATVTGVAGAHLMAPGNGTAVPEVIAAVRRRVARAS